MQSDTARSLSELWKNRHLSTEANPFNAGQSEEEEVHCDVPVNAMAVDVLLLSYMCRRAILDECSKAQVVEPFQAPFAVRVLR